MTTASVAGASRPRTRGVGALAGVVPFFAYTTVFLLVPTLIVVVGAFLDRDGRPTGANLAALAQPAFQRALYQSVVLSAVTAVIGALVGAVLAYAISTGARDGLLRKFVTSLCGVLAQFGGVALAFAFTASFTASGYLNGWLKSLGVATGDGLWLYQWDRGLIVVYLFFQIPLMLIVFLPAVEGLRPQWREATETLGGSTLVYWTRVALPILTPSFIGALLLLFTNAFSAYATAQALISQAAPTVPQQIAGTLNSEVLLGQENVGKAMALSMVVVVAIVMAIYTVIDKRASRWLAGAR